VPMPAVIKWLADFGRMKTAAQELEQDEVALIRGRVGLGSANSPSLS
jgi:hypothetical protein